MKAVTCTVKHLGLTGVIAAAAVTAVTGGVVDDDGGIVVGIRIHRRVEPVLKWSKCLHFGFYSGQGWSNRKQKSEQHRILLCSSARKSTTYCHSNVRSGTEAINDVSVHYCHHRNTDEATITAAALA